MSTPLSGSEARRRRRRFFDGASSSTSTASSVDLSRARMIRLMAAAEEEIISGNCFFLRRLFLGWSVGGGSEKTGVSGGGCGCGGGERWLSGEEESEVAFWRCWSEVSGGESVVVSMGLK